MLLDEEDGQTTGHCSCLSIAIEHNFTLGQYQSQHCSTSRALNRCEETRGKLGTYSAFTDLHAPQRSIHVLAAARSRAGYCDSRSICLLLLHYELLSRSSDRLVSEQERRFGDQTASEPRVNQHIHKHCRLRAGGPPGSYSFHPVKWHTMYLGH